MNQPPLQRPIVRQTLPNLTLFASPDLTCRTKLIRVRRMNGAAFGKDLRISDYT